MSVHLGTILSPDVVVDHINNDKMDDRIENLQILSTADNIRKSSKGVTKYLRVCPMCKTTFSIEARQLSGKTDPCCSRSCGGKKSHLTKNLK